MMSLETIRHLSRVAGNKARHEGRKPWVPEGEGEISEENLRRIPNLGQYVPKGWKRAEEWFVDSSGFGREGEPALTIGQFVEAVKEYFGHHPGCGLGIVEVGQFQVYVAAFEKIARPLRAEKVA